MLPCEPLCQFAGRLFFTTFPAPAPHSTQVNQAASHLPLPKIRSRSRAVPPASDDHTALYHWFTIDDDLTYLSFFEDWGPLNIAMVYRACIYIHELLEDAALKRHRLVLYSSSDSRKKANAALIMALYVLVVLHRPPWEAFYPIAELDFMPFRDAGRGRSDFDLSIHDCLWGFWKAQRNGLINMNDFSLREYEFYEKVENGDWNWITPGFLAFASPSDTAWIRQQRIAASSSITDAVPSIGTTSFKRKLPQPFQNCIDYFEERDVKLVVRLNNPLYDKTVFEEQGMEHLELYFDDGTNPTDDIVREFIARSELVFEAGGAVAVHCKAGLGRTGTLIGAYLIYKYDFTANEAIAFMRICRPGCVVGPQQQYLYERQMDWVRWAALDQAKREVEGTDASRVPAVPRPVTPPMEEQKLAPVTPSRPALVSIASTAKVEAMLPPGQPRKTPTGKRVALEMLGENEEDEDENASEDSMEDVKGNLTGHVTKQSRTLTPSGKTVMKTATAVRGLPTKAPAARQQAPATTGRPTRASPRIQGLANAKRVIPPPALGLPRSNATNASSTLPRRAREEPAPRTRAQTQGLRSRPTPSKIPSRKPMLPRSGALLPSGKANAPNPLSKVPLSRLPTLAPKRTLGATALTMSSVLPTIKNTTLDIVLESPTSVGFSDLGEADKEDAWMSGVDARSVVEPGTKSGRPSIRSVRPRRSSFSSVDIL